MAHELAWKTRAAEKRHYARTQAFAYPIEALRQPLPPSSLQSAICCLVASSPQDALRSRYAKSLQRQLFRLNEPQSIGKHNTELSTRSTGSAEWTTHITAEDNAYSSTFLLIAHLLSAWDLYRQAGSDSDVLDNRFPIDDLDSIVISTANLAVLLEEVANPLFTGLLLLETPSSSVRALFDVAQQQSRSSPTSAFSDFYTRTLAVILLQSFEPTFRELASSILLESQAPIDRTDMEMTDDDTSLGQKLRTLHRSIIDSGDTLSCNPRIYNDHFPSPTDLCMHIIRLKQNHRLFAAWSSILRQSMHPQLKGEEADRLLHFVLTYFPSSFPALAKQNSIHAEDVLLLLCDLIAAPTIQRLVAADLCQVAPASLAPVVTHSLGLLPVTSQFEIITRFWDTHHHGLLRGYNISVAGVGTVLELFNKMTETVESDLLALLLVHLLLDPITVANKFVHDFFHQQHSAPRLARYLSSTPLPLLSVNTAGGPSLLVDSLRSAFAGFVEDPSSLEKQLPNILGAVAALTSQMDGMLPLVEMSTFLSQLSLPALAALLPLPTSMPRKDLVNYSTEALIQLHVEVIGLALNAHDPSSPLDDSLLQGLVHIMILDSFLFETPSKYGASKQRLTGEILIQAKPHAAQLLDFVLSHRPQIMLSWITILRFVSNISSDSPKLPLSVPEVLPASLTAFLSSNTRSLTVSPILLWDSLFAGSVDPEIALNLSTAYANYLERHPEVRLQKHLSIASLWVLPRLCARETSHCLDHLLIPLFGSAEFSCSWDNRLAKSSDEKCRDRTRLYTFLCDLLIQFAEDKGGIVTKLFGSAVFMTSEHAYWDNLLTNVTFGWIATWPLLSDSTHAFGPFVLLSLIYITSSQLLEPLMARLVDEESQDVDSVLKKLKLLFMELYKKLQALPLPSKECGDLCKTLREELKTRWQGQRQKLRGEVFDELLRLLPDLDKLPIDR